VLYPKGGITTECVSFLSAFDCIFVLRDGLASIGLSQVAPMRAPILERSFHEQIKLHARCRRDLRRGGYVAAYGPRRPCGLGNGTGGGVGGAWLIFIDSEGAVIVRYPASRRPVQRKART
jgi:hypothetical protein